MKPSRYTQLRDGLVQNTGSNAIPYTEPPVTDENIQTRLTNAERLLTMPENEIRQYAKNHGYDSTLPIETLQEEVFTSTVTQLETKYGGYSPEKVAQIKDQFIDAIGEAYFIGLAAQRAGVPRKLVTAWLKADLDFAERVYEKQSLMAEKVGVTLLAEGIHWIWTISPFASTTCALAIKSISRQTCSKCSSMLSRSTPRITSFTFPINSGIPSATRSLHTRSHGAQ